MTDDLTPEEVAKNEALTIQILEGATMAERTEAARALGIMSPPGEPVAETGMVFQMVRSPDGKFWVLITGKEKLVSKFIFDDAAVMLNVLSMSATLMCLPFMTDEEVQKQRDAE